MNDVKEFVLANGQSKKTLSGDNVKTSANKLNLTNNMANKNSTLINVN